MIFEKLKEIEEEIGRLAKRLNMNFEQVAHEMLSMIGMSFYLNLSDIIYEDEVDNDINITPKKYGISMLNQKNDISFRYDYIPMIRRNQPYHRRVFIND